MIRQRLCMGLDGLWFRLHSSRKVCLQNTSLHVRRMWKLMQRVTYLCTRFAF